MEKKTISWRTVIILLIIFWPIGLYLLYRKYATEKSAIFKNVKKLKIVAYILIGFGVASAVMAITGNMKHSETDVAYSFQENMEVVGMSLVLFIGGGTLLLNKAKRTETLAQRYKKYLDLVVNAEVTSISKIASITMFDEEMIKEDLQKMIDSGYFQGGYLDMSNNEIVIKNNRFYSNEDNQKYVEQVVVCPSCGAQNLVNNLRVCRCEYCDTYLEISEN